MEKKSMTKRDFLVKVKALVSDPEVLEKADELLENLDKRNAARSSKPSKTQLKNEPIKKAILEYLAKATVYVPASVIAKEINCDSPNTITALCGQFVKEGVLAVEKVKSTAKSGGKVNGYKLADISEVADEDTEE